MSRSADRLAHYHGGHGAEQRLAVDSLSQEGRRAGVDDPLPRLGRVVAGDDHDRDGSPRPRKAGEDVEPVDAWHVQVEHEAAWPPGPRRREERFPSGERLNLEAGRAEQPPQRATDRLVIIHDRN